MYRRVWSSIINFVDRFSTTKKDLPNYTLILVLSLEQGLGIRTLQHEKNPVLDSSIRIQ